MTKSIFPNDNIYLTKWQNCLSNWQSVFVQMTKMYFSKWLPLQQALLFRIHPLFCLHCSLFTSLWAFAILLFDSLKTFAQFSICLQSVSPLSIFCQSQYFKHRLILSFSKWRPNSANSHIYLFVKAKTHWGRAGWIPGCTGSGAGGQTVQVSYTCTAPGIKNI